MKKLVLLSALLFCMTIGFAQEAKEFATVSSNRMDKKHILITYANKTIEWQNPEKKNVSMNSLMLLLNELSEQGWSVKTAYVTSLGNSYLLERKKQ